MTNLTLTQAQLMELAFALLHSKSSTKTSEKTFLQLRKKVLAEVKKIEESKTK
jgi:hypothetical protein